MHLGERHAVGCLIQIAHVIPDRQSRPHRPVRIVLMQDRDAEHRHEPVPHDLGNGPAEVSCQLHERRHGWPKESIDLLVIERFGERRVAGEVGEQHGNELAFAVLRDDRRTRPPRGHVVTRRGKSSATPRRRTTYPTP